MSQQGNSNAQIATEGSFCLSGPVDRPDPQREPIRGDLAHIALAGKHFVPHYAVPQPRIVLAGGAPLLAEADAQAEELCILAQGDSFDVLDVTRQWAWGCLSIDGPVGYIRLNQLETGEG